MIISKTPLRISLFGGGTDFPAFYRKHGGAVLSMAIDKYVYVIAHPRNDAKIIVHWSAGREVCNNVEDVRHELIRESLKLTGWKGGVEIATAADVDGGAGIGSSSAITVGALRVLKTWGSAAALASAACEVELDRLKKPVGKQDQYISAHGGFCFTQFNRANSIEAEVETTRISSVLAAPLLDRLMLFDTGGRRNADDILSVQDANTRDNAWSLEWMRDAAYEARGYIADMQLNKLGELFHEAWRRKRELAPGISNSFIDNIYEKALKAGAVGGKICGAGGGGMMLFFVPRLYRTAVENAMASNGLIHIPFQLSKNGSHIICKETE